MRNPADWTFGEPTLPSKAFITGRIRAIPDADVPARASTWGRLKLAYR